MKRKLEIYQYGSKLSPTRLSRYSPSDWLEISVSGESPSEKSLSGGIPLSSTSSASDASTGVQNELPSPQDLSEEFSNICHFFQARIGEIGADLPCSWSIEEFTLLVIGEEEILAQQILGMSHYWLSVYLNQTKRLASTKQGPIELSLEQIEKVSRSREPLAEDPSLSL